LEGLRRSKPPREIRIDIGSIKMAGAWRLLLQIPSPLK
jgi:hypothetical protein